MANIYSWPNEDDNYMKSFTNSEATYLGTYDTIQLLSR